VCMHAWAYACVCGCVARACQLLVRMCDSVHVCTCVAVYQQEAYETSVEGDYVCVYMCVCACVLVRVRVLCASACV